MLENFRNKVFNQDVLILLKQLPDNSVDMVYGDPDYNVGINYAGKNYTKKWNEYIDWYIELTKESMRVLKPTGNLFMVNYPKQNSYLRVKYLDENAFDVHDYVWIYTLTLDIAHVTLPPPTEVFCMQQRAKTITSTKNMSLFLIKTQQTNASKSEFQKVIWDACLTLGFTLT
jgi:DNA modification methylase